MPTVNAETVPRGRKVRRRLGADSCPCSSSEG
jgi:hypothetical protein